MKPGRAVALIPAWWPIVVARYRRCTPVQRAVLEIVAFRIWARAEGAEVEVDGRAVAALIGRNENHVQRSLAALLAGPGEAVEPGRSERGHGILKLVRVRPRNRPRLVALNPWPTWWWSRDQRAEVEAAIARELAPPPPEEADRWSRLLYDHLRAGRHATGAEPFPGEKGWSYWTRAMGELVARRYTVADLRAILGYVEAIADPHWRQRIRGPHAARRLVNDWECLYQRVRREEE